MVNLCPTCGAVKPQHQMFARHHIRASIFEYIRSHPGCTRAEVVRAVWKNIHVVPNIVSVHITNMRAELAANGLDIKGGKGRVSKGYFLVKLDSLNVS